MSIKSPPVQPPTGGVQPAPNAPVGAPNDASIPRSAFRLPRSAWATVRRLRWTEFRLLLAPSLLSIIGMLMVILVPTGAIQWQWTGIWQSFLFTGLLYGLHA